MAEGESSRVRGFAVPLVGIALAGVAIRLVYVLALSRGLHDSGDSEFFHRLANLIGDGRGFVEPIGLALTGDGRPTALHPPLYPLLLGLFSWLGVDSYLGQRVVGCVIGFFAVCLVGLLGRRVGGPRVGLIAAAIAAVYPVLIGADGAVMSESLYGALFVAALLLGYRVAGAGPGRGRGRGPRVQSDGERAVAGGGALPSGRRTPVAAAAALGAVIGLAALTRAEALALLVLVLVPLAWRGANNRRAALTQVAAGVAAAALVLVPWTARNWSAFDKPILISNNSGTLISGANCDRTYSGPLIGSWSIYCVKPGPSTNEATAAAHERRVGLEYAADHAERLPAVLGVRLMRTFGTFDAAGEARVAESQAYGMALAGAIAWLVLVPVGVYGAIVLRRRRQPLLMLAAPVALVALVSLLGYGIPRFRHPADLALVVLAAVAVDSVLSRLAGRLRAGASAG